MSDRDQQDEQLAKQAAAFHVQVEAAKAFDQQDEQIPQVLRASNDGEGSASTTGHAVASSPSSQQDEQVTASCDRCEWAGSLNDVVAHILTHSHGYAEGERAATERHVAIIKGTRDWYREHGHGVSARAYLMATMDDLLNAIERGEHE